MTREEQIESVLKLINPPAGRRQACREHIKGELAHWELTGEIGHSHLADEAMKAKPKRKLTEQFRAALVRLKHTARGWPPGEMLGGMYEDWDAISPTIDLLIARCDAILRRKSDLPRRSAAKQRWAAKAAFDLTVEYRPEGLSTKMLDRIGATLYGDPKVKLTRYSQAQMRRWEKPGSN